MYIDTYHRDTLGTPSILTPLPSLSDEFFTINWTQKPIQESEAQVAGPWTFYVTILWVNMSEPKWLYKHET